MGTLTSGASVGVSGRRQRVSPRPSPRASFKGPTSSGRGWGEQGLPASDLKRFESEACVLEGALFEWFLRDVVISAEFGQTSVASSPLHVSYISIVFTSGASQNTHRHSRPPRRFRHWAPSLG